MQAGDGDRDGALCGVPEEAAQRQQLSPGLAAAPRTIGGWQKVRNALVSPQGGIKAPYVPGLNRCSRGVTPVAIPSLPPALHLPCIHRWC